MIDIRVFLELEAQLLRRLRKTWRPLAASLQAKVVEAINAGDFASAYGLAREVDLSDVGEKNRQYIKYMMLANANFGARLVSDTKSTFVSSGTFDAMLDKVTDNFCKSLEHNATIQTYKSIVQSIAEAEKKLEEVKKAAKPRYVREFVDFTEAGDEMLQLISGLHSSRLSVWGFAAEAEVLGLTQYKLSAVLDGRTSDFCRMINGKTFEVADARKSINEILSVENPDDVKVLQPWPKQDKASMEEFASMSAQELTARGLHIPPFHPKCRTMLVRVGKAPRLSKPEVDKERQKIPNVTATKEMFQSLGLEMSDETLQHWNAYVGVSPILLLAKLSGYTPQEILEGVLGKLYKTISISKNGDIKFSTRKKIKDKGKVGSDMVYDPYNGHMHLNAVEFSNVKASDATAFLKEHLGGAVDVAESIGAKTLSITVGGELGAYTFSKMGMLPSASDWFDIKETLLEGLEGKRFGFVAEGLMPSQLKVVKDLLNSKNESSIAALASLPFKVGGKPVGQILLAGFKYDAILDLSNKKMVAAFKDSL
jgi:hypothetical protein